MAIVADYRIIADGKIEITRESHFPVREFSMPENFVRGMRTVLFFNLWKDAQVDLDLKVFINGSGQQAQPEYRIVLRGDTSPLYAVHEIIAPNRLQQSDNRILFSPADSNFNDGQVSISDVLVLCQVDI